MKCLVLAGGKGNSLWPLSRERYPKQFINLKGNRSLFQETIARNLPFCEEFLIITNKEYYFIIESQMQSFQGVKYRCFLEEERKGTAPALITVSMYCNPSELIYAVSADLHIDNFNYKEAVVAAQELAKVSAAVIFGIDARGADTNFGYFLSEKQRVINFHEKPERKEAQRYISQGYQWNSGNMLFLAKNFLKEIKKLNPVLFQSCEKIHNKLCGGRRVICLPFGKLKEFQVMSIEHAFLEKSKNIYAVHALYGWCDIGNFDMLLQWNQSLQQNAIIENSRNTQVINGADNKLVVINNIDEALIVNTDDAILITSKAEVNQRKRVITNYLGEYNDFFENSNIRYRTWGMYENLTKGGGYKVKKVTILPGRGFNSHKHNYRSEHWSIVKGIATVRIEEKTKDYYPNSSIFVPAGYIHCIANNTNEDIIIIEVSIGDDIKEEDTVSFQKDCSIVKKRYDTLVKLEPAFKDYLWGGDKLKTKYHKKCDYDIIAESWEVSAHSSGQSIIAEGQNRGMLFGEYLNIIGKDAWGWKCQAFDEFPIMIKFIDAKENLSVQVHPQDEYALSKEKQYGKNEMWHILECEENAYLYCGLKENISREKLQQMLESGEILEVLNRIPVNKGDTFFIEAGTIHAIGAGILVCEIQQNSDVTYRLYDYNRKDAYGNSRELHITKALDVSNLQKWGIKKQTSVTISVGADDNVIEELGACKYFKGVKYIVKDSIDIQNDETSFRTITFLKGSGIIIYEDKEESFMEGDNFFLCAGKHVMRVIGNSEFIITTI